MPILCFTVLGYLILALESRAAADFFRLGISVLLLFVIWLMPEWLGILSFRKKKNYYNGDLPDNVIQFGEELYICDKDSTHTIPYDKIKKMKIVEGCIALRLKDGSSIGLPNGPFTVGNLQELLLLLKERCPQLKLPYWQ